VDDALELVLGKLDGVRQHAGYWMARCPAHDDDKASLSVARGTEQPVVLKCHAGCDQGLILDAVGLTLADISKPREQDDGEWTPFGNAIDVYDYEDEFGKLLYQVLRTADKQFPQRRPDAAKRSGWNWSLKGVRRVPYRLPKVIAAAADGRVIYITEGEKDVKAVEAAGGVATTSPGGAGKWRDDYDAHFAGANVVIVADADEPGRRHAADIERHLQPVAETVRIVEAAHGKDAADHLSAGHSLAELLSTDAPAVTSEAADPLPDEPKTELGYARRLIAVYGDRLRYIPVWRRWLVWDGARWAHDTTGQSARWMKAIARRITADALAIEDEQKRRSALSLARRGESSAGVAGALTLAGTEDGIAVTPEDLDADPQLLNCRNGTLDLRNGELRDHDPGDLLTKMTGAAFDPAATGAAFSAFLDRVQPEPGMRAYLARLIGHALEGRVLEHILPIFHGDGANGKGTFTGAILAALGDYADAADPELLNARTFEAHPTGVADLFGLRLAILHESDAGRRLAEGTVKRLTGGDRLKARRMREDFWHFEPSHTFVLLTNHKPVVTGQDEGIWRRLRLVPWDVVIPPDERDDHLGGHLRRESDHVLAWLIRGYQDWREHGFADPEQVTEATAAYRAGSDDLGRFLDQQCVTGPNFHVRSSELFAAWAKWCTTEGAVAGTNKAFTESLQNRGYDTRRSRVGVVWDGIGLTDEGA
jgi:putative DNA primase/helicase